jgi:hypothetical protein
VWTALGAQNSRSQSDSQTNRVICQSSEARNASLEAAAPKLGIFTFFTQSDF